MQTGIFSNSWVVENGDPNNSTSYSIPPLSGRGRPWTIFRQVKQKDSNLTVNMLKGELQPKISLLHMKVLTLIKAKSNVFL